MHRCFSGPKNFRRVAISAYFQHMQQSIIQAIPIDSCKAISVHQHVKLSSCSLDHLTQVQHTRVYIYISYTVCIHVSYHIENLTLQCRFTNIIYVILYIYVPSRQRNQYSVAQLTSALVPGLVPLPWFHNVSSILYLVVLLDLDGYYIIL